MEHNDKILVNDSKNTITNKNEFDLVFRANGIELFKIEFFRLSEMMHCAITTNLEVKDGGKIGIGV